ncbi:MAG: bifunctional 3,4-dihydroxy-2-butanone-4-phosphate synthase/GTP cyclohydrolase II [Endomicrobiia bacterium]
MEKIFSTIPQAIEDYKKGKAIIIVDDPCRENEGDIVFAAEKITPEKINFMAKYGRGLICVSLLKERLDELKIFPMVDEPDIPREAAFTVSVDAREGITTGISAYDRATTIKKLIDKNSTAKDFVRPGHVFPLVYKDGGVLVRAGHTEASVDLAKLAGLYPAGVICEIMHEDGTMARLPELIKFAKKHKLKIITISSLIKYLHHTQKFVKRIVSTVLPTEFGEFKLYVYENTITKEHHLAIVKGNVKNKKNVLVRVHSSCLTGDALGSLRCDCGIQLKQAMKLISQKGEGVIIYLYQEGRGIGLTNKLKAYELQDKGLDTVEANIKLGFQPDLRDYGIGAQILTDLGLTTIKLITNNPRKIVGLDGYGLKIVDRVPIEVSPKNVYMKKYLMSKKNKLGHLFKHI